MREEGGLNARGNRKVPGNIWSMGLVRQDPLGFGLLAGRQNLLFLRREVGVVRKWNLLRAEGVDEDA